VPAVRHVSAERLYRTGLDAPCARDQCEETRFADSIGSDEPDDTSRGQIKADVLERNGMPVAQTDTS
jgi:hypothetical protein